MTKKKKQEGVRDKNVKMYGFRLDSNTRKDLDEVVNMLADGNKTDFFKNAIRFFKDNPELYHQGKVLTADNIPTREDIDEIKREINQLNQQMQINIEMSQLLLDQQENGVKQHNLAILKEVLLSYEHLEELDDYGKVEAFLLKKLPDLESIIIVDKVYNEILFESMQEGKLLYDKRSKKLNWRVDNK